MSSFVITNKVWLSRHFDVAPNNSNSAKRHYRSPHRHADYLPERFSVHMSKIRRGKR